jgi:hypothetical protein
MLFVKADNVEFTKVALILGADVNRCYNNVSPLQLVKNRKGSNK